MLCLFACLFESVSVCQDAGVENDPADSYWYIYRHGDGFPLRENKPITSSSITFIFLSSPSFPISYRYHSPLSGSDPRSPSLHLTLTPQPPEGPLPPSTRCLTRAALIYCPLLPLSPIFPSCPLTTPRFFSPPVLPLSLHPSHWVMATRAGSHPAAAWDRHWSQTQSLWGWGRSHPFCTCTHPAQSTLYFLGCRNYRSPHFTNAANRICLR